MDYQTVLENARLTLRWIVENKELLLASVPVIAYLVSKIIQLTRDRNALIHTIEDGEKIMDRVISNGVGQLADGKDFTVKDVVKMTRQAVKDEIKERGLKSLDKAVGKLYPKRKEQSK